MKKISSIIRQLLYKYLSFENYLYVLSKAYFLTFNLRMLKNNEAYAYPYFLKNIIKPGTVVIDIGANLGYLAVIFSKLVGDKGKVHAVEPVNPVRKILTKNTKGLTNIQIYPYALGNENKFIQLGNNTRIKKGYVASGSHFVMDQKANNKANTDVVFEAEMRKGSELFSQLDQLDFIKCDIEGFETVVLPEMEAIIMRFKPSLLVETGGSNRKQMLDFFNERNYDAYILNNGYLQPTNETESRDILFVHQEKHNSISKYFQPKAAVNV